MRFPRLDRALAGHAVALTLFAAAAPSAAHDTWFRSLPSPAAGDALLLLGTGNRFPEQEYAIGREHLRRAGCRSGSTPGALAPVQLTPHALLLRGSVARVQGAASRGPLSCWAQLAPFDVELTADLVQVYLDDIAAPQALRQTWAEMKARGLGWKERFTKHARVELAAVGAIGPRALPPASPTDMGMDVLLESGLGAIASGDALVFRVLRDGKPLPNFAVELRSERPGDAVWLETDAEGRIRWQPPAAGAWVLRGTDLRLSETTPDAWESRFVTLAFYVGAPGAGG